MTKEKMFTDVLMISESRAVNFIENFPNYFNGASGLLDAESLSEMENVKKNVENNKKFLVKEITNEYVMMTFCLFSSLPGGYFTLLKLNREDFIHHFLKELASLIINSPEVEVGSDEFSSVVGSIINKRKFFNEQMNKSSNHKHSFVEMFAEKITNLLRVKNPSLVLTYLLVNLSFSLDEELLIIKKLLAEK